MTAGSVVLVALPQADGASKNRPALVLGPVKPFGDLVVCGISTQVHLAVAGFDEVVDSGEPDFARSGLRGPSVIRLGYLATLPLAGIKGRIGVIDPVRHRRLVRRLSELVADFSEA